MSSAEIAVIAFAQLPSRAQHTEREEAELVESVTSAAMAQVGLSKGDIGFTCSGSSDYLLGRPFSFVMALDGVAPFPPIHESHVEMDGAWALYEAWIRLQHGDIHTALVYSYGKSSLGSLPDILTQQLDPYYLAPLWPDATNLAALQARALLDTGKISELEMAQIAVRNRQQGQLNPNAHAGGHFDAEDLLRQPYVCNPLRAHDCPPSSDGAACVILATREQALKLTSRPAFITGFDHRIDTHHLGLRDLTVAPSATLAAQMAGANTAGLELAELHAPFTHQEKIVRVALQLDDNVELNPSGGALSAHPMMVAGLIRIGEAATRIIDGSARRVLGHASSGPCLQQNLVCVMEAEA